MDKSQFDISLGIYIKKLREESGLSQCDLAALMNNNPQNISAYESGKRNPGTFWIDRLCESLKINPIKFYSDFYNNHLDKNNEKDQIKQDLNNV